MTRPVTSRPTLLSVNVNAVAYLRNRREVPWPNLIDIARAILQAGAHGITVHPARMSATSVSPTCRTCPA